MAIALLSSPYLFGDPRLPQTFWRNVTVAETGCWEWTASTNHAGYGRWRSAIVDVPGPKTWRVHRLTFEVFVGGLSDELTVDHLCRVRHCCNPSHLEQVTQRENTLRGDTLNAENVAKTHCPQGHPYDAANTYTCPKGRRNCRVCVAVSRKRWAEANPKKVRAKNLRCEARRVERQRLAGAA